MCLAVPVRLKEKLAGDIGIFEYAGVTKEVNLQLLDTVEEGDYILVHAGFAIERLDEASALETLEMMKKMAFLENEDEGRL